MSRKMEYRCDRCGHVITTSVHTLDLKEEPTGDVEFAKDTDAKLFDMCATCWGKLLEFLRAGFP